jgi:hypothetical protein
LVKGLVRFEDCKSPDRVDLIKMLNPLQSSHGVDLTKILNPPHMPHGVDLSSPFKKIEKSGSRFKNELFNSKLNYENFHFQRIK